MKRLGEIILLEGTKKELLFSSVHGDEIWVKTDKTGKHFSLKNERGFIEDIKIENPSYTITVTMIPSRDISYVYMYLENSDTTISGDGETTRPKAIYLDGELIDWDKLVYERNSGTNAYYYTGKTLVKGSLHIIQYEFNSGDFTVTDPAFGGYYMYNYGYFDASLIMSNDITSISQRMFYDGSFSSIILSNGITVIPERAFQNCKLNFIKLPNSLQRIESQAFYNGFRSDVETLITIPKSVTYIAVDAFDGTDTLQIYYEGTEAEWLTLIINSLAAQEGAVLPGILASVICSDTPTEEEEEEEDS